MPSIPRSLKSETAEDSESLNGKSWSNSKAFSTGSPSITLNRMLANPLVVGDSAGALKNNLVKPSSSISTKRKIGDWRISGRTNRSVTWRINIQTSR
jgi:hypothetical protein